MELIDIVFMGKVAWVIGSMDLVAGINTYIVV